MPAIWYLGTALLFWSVAMKSCKNVLIIFLSLCVDLSAYHSLEMVAGFS
jgi:hypothetical protein